jgi:hypothetical protein
MIVQYHPLTASDLDSAISYYNQQRAGLGEEFRAEVYAAIERITYRVKFETDPKTKQVTAKI